MGRTTLDIGDCSSGIQTATDIDLVNGAINNGVTVPLAAAGGDANGNGILDGADKMPVNIKNMLGLSVVSLVRREFSVTTFGSTTVDVNILLFDYRPFAQGYGEMTILTPVTALPLCAPAFESTTLFGSSQPSNIFTETIIGSVEHFAVELTPPPSVSTAASVHAPISGQFPTVDSTTRDAHSGGGSGQPIGTDFPSAGCNVVTTCNLLAQGVLGAGSGGQFVCDRAWHDGDSVGNNTVGGGTVTGSDPGPFCESVKDSDADGTPDNLSNFNSQGVGDPGIYASQDINSDADADGCSDNYEALGGCNGDPLNASSEADATHISGADDVCPKNGIADWRDDVAGTQHPSSLGAGDCGRFWTTAIPQSNSINPNGGGSPDSDGDGCSNRREAVVGTSMTILNAGGGRDALNPYDFADVPTPPNSVAGTRDKVVKLADVLAALTYVGTSSGSPNTPNANGVTYGGRAATMAFPGDSNNDGRSNGAEYDRVGGAIAGISKAPNGTVTLSDVLVVLAQVGTNCATSP